MLKAWFYSQLHEYNVESYHSLDDRAVTIQSGHSDIFTDKLHIYSRRTRTHCTR